MSFRPEIVHVHNTFATLSPSIYGSCKVAGATVIQTLHNYRLLCPSALFLRNGTACELCVDKSLLQSIAHRCYRNSALATSVVAATLATHRMFRTYQRHVTTFISLTAFAKSRFIRAGFDPQRVVIKGNFLPDPPPPGPGNGGYALYVGRLAEGKGVHTLLAAWQGLAGIPLRIVGNGSEMPELVEFARTHSLNVTFLGSCSRTEVLEQFSRASLTVVPSQCYEGFPMVVVESYACGTPVIASRIGSLSELIAHGITGWHFAPGNATDLRSAVQTAWNTPALHTSMRAACRQYFTQHLTEERNASELIEIYRTALRA